MNLATADLQFLRSRVPGIVVTPADPGWNEARQAWNLCVDQRPAAVVVPEDAAGVASAIAFARECGLRVAPQTTGHNAAPLGDLEGSILLRTSSLRDVGIDPVRRRARVGAGALWQDVMEPAHAHGLVALGGSAPDVGVVGYSLGGGIGWLSRLYGLATNSLLAVELVTPDGRLVRADDEHETDLFWALRGGGGNFGVVTALEFALYPHAEVYGGMMAWDWSESERVLQRWSEWAAGALDAVTTSARIMRLPPLPDIPEPLRGRRLVMIDGAYAGDPATAEEVLAPLRELGPELDFFGVMPSPGLIRLHGDPEHPVPGLSDHAMLASLPAEAVRAFVAAGPARARPCCRPSCASWAARSDAPRPATTRCPGWKPPSRCSPSGSPWTTRWPRRPSGTRAAWWRRWSRGSPGAPTSTSPSARPTPPPSITPRTSVVCRAFAPESIPMASCTPTTRSRRPETAKATAPAAGPMMNPPPVPARRHSLGRTSPC